MRKWAFILLVLLASCVKEQDAGMDTQVRFQASASPFEGDTKATPVTSLSGSFEVLAYTYASKSAEGNFYGKALMEESGGVWSGNLYWPGYGHGGGQADAVRYVRFCAFAPYSLSSRLEGSTLKGIPVSGEEDMLVAETALLDDNPAAGDLPVPLRFHHALTGVRFQADEGYTIHSVTLSGIYGEGDYSLLEGGWKNQRTPSSYTGYPSGEMLLLLPQLLPAGADITLSVSYKGRTPETISLADLIQGTTWHAGTVVTYLISLEQYTYEVGLIPAPGMATTEAGGQEVPLIEVGVTAETTPNVFQVNSYRVDEAGVEADVPWTIRGVYSDAALTEPVELVDGYYSWLKDFSGEGGKGSPVTLVSRDAPIDHTDDNEAFIRETLRSRAPVGTSANPLNLSDRQADGSYATGSYIRESANCYIVNRPGWYKFPMIMGNGVKNHALNPSAYYFSGTRPYPERTLARFRDYQDREITNPILTNPYIVAVLWADRQNLIESYTPYRDNNGICWIQFEVTQEDIDQGNLVFAAMDYVLDNYMVTYRVMWSWHIWFTDYVPGQGDLRVNSHSGKSYTFMPLNLGWTELSQADIALESTLYVQLETENGMELGTFAVRKAGGELNHTYLGRAPTYQWGRKDPVIPGMGANDYDDISGMVTLLPQYLQQEGHDYVVAGWIEDGYPAPSLGESIQTPHVFRQQRDGGDWCSTYWINRWNAAQTGTYGRGFSPGENYSIVKTIYDPSPAGYHVPPVMAFSGLTRSGGEATSLDGLNLDPEDGTVPNFRGYRFKPDAASDVIEFPIAGFRQYRGDYPLQFYRSGGMTYYWSAEMYNQAGAAYALYMVDTRDVKVAPLQTVFTGLCAYVRPVHD